MSAKIIDILFVLILWFNCVKVFAVDLNQESRVKASLHMFCLQGLETSLWLRVCTVPVRF